MTAQNGELDPLLPGWAEVALTGLGIVVALAVVVALVLLVLRTRAGRADGADASPRER